MVSCRHNAGSTLSREAATLALPTSWRPRPCFFVFLRIALLRVNEAAFLHTASFAAGTCPLVFILLWLLESPSSGASPDIALALRLQPDPLNPHLPPYPLIRPLFLPTGRGGSQGAALPLRLHPAPRLAGARRAGARHGEGCGADHEQRQGGRVWGILRRVAGCVVITWRWWRRG